MFGQISHSNHKVSRKISTGHFELNTSVVIGKVTIKHSIKISEQLFAQIASKFALCIVAQAGKLVTEAELSIYFTLFSLRMFSLMTHCLRKVHVIYLSQKTPARNINQQAYSSQYVQMYSPGLWTILKKFSSPVSSSFTL